MYSKISNSFVDVIVNCVLCNKERDGGRWINLENNLIDNQLSECRDLYFHSSP